MLRRSAFLFCAIGAIGVLAVLGAWVGGRGPGFAGPAACHAPAQGPASWLSVEPMFGGRSFRKPIQAIQHPADPEVWFVAESEGRVLRLEGEEAAVVLDIRDRVRAGDQWGLQGIALPPGFPEDARVFLTYTATAPSPQNVLQGRVAVFRSADGGRTFDPASERILLAEGQKHVWHSIAGLRFGPDGMLYVGWGEGGGLQPSQDPPLLRGKILRLDVASERGGGHAIPPDNPFPNGPFRPEVWAAGFRNPWRFSFDPKTGALWAGDVGGRRFEEIDRVERGRHYGWPWREGFDCLWPDGCPMPSTPPVHVHGAQSVCSIIGGHVYRGRRLPALRGKYVYGDYCARTLYSFDPETGESELLARLPVEQIASLEVDREGELYVVEAKGQSQDPETIEEKHRVYRLVATGERPEPNQVGERTLASLGCQAPQGPAVPPPGMIAYQPTAPAWDEGASAVRFVSPGFRRLEPFDETVVGRPKVYLKTLLVDGLPVETQMLAVGWLGEWDAWSFEWDDEGKGARLVTRPKTRILRNGLEWRYDTAPACFRCHNEAAGRVLGLTARQLDGATEGSSQLERWLDAGVLEGAEDPARFLEKLRRSGRLVDPADPSRPLEARVRSYLHANCGSCHRPGGETAAARLDLSESGSLTALCGMRAGSDYPELPDALLVDPGHPERSLLSLRLAATDSLAMPPGRTQADPVGTEIVAAWIHGLGTECGRSPA